MTLPMALRMAALTDDDRRRLRTAVHEAGHAVAATALGGRIHTAVVCEDTTAGVFGKTVHDDVPEGAWPQVTYAGPWAEARWLAGGRPTQRDIHTILSTTGHRDDKALCASGGFTEGVRVVPLLERCWPSVVTVAKKLLRDGEARHEHVCTALGLSDDGGPTSFELSLIRAGSAPGTFTVTRPA